MPYYFYELRDEFKGELEFLTGPSANRLEDSFRGSEWSLLFVLPSESQRKAYVVVEGLEPKEDVELFRPLVGEEHRVAFNRVVVYAELPEPFAAFPWPDAPTFVCCGGSPPVHAADCENAKSAWKSVVPDEDEPQ